MEKNTGGPAFPTPEPRCPECNAEVLNFVNGMTIRDYFAAAALTGLRGHPANDRPIDCASWSYEVADAMIAARGI